MSIRAARVLIVVAAGLIGLGRLLDLRDEARR